MDILRNLFGSLTSGIIRLAVTVGIIAAIGFFLLKPVLESAEKQTEGFRNSLNQSLGENDLGDLNKTLKDVNRQVEREIKRSFHVAKLDGNPRRLVKCVQRARGDVHRIQRCTVKF